MEAFIELLTQISHLTQQLQIKQQAYGRHQRVASLMWHSNMSLREVHYVGNPYLNTYDLGWPHHPYLPWEIIEDIPQPPQAKELSLERTMAELTKYQVEFANSQAQFMNETRATLQIQLTQFESLEVQVGQMTKILLEEQQRSLLTLEEPIREEVDVKE